MYCQNAQMTWQVMCIHHRDSKITIVVDIWCKYPSHAKDIDYIHELLHGLDSFCWVQNLFDTIILENNLRKSGSWTGNLMLEEFYVFDNSIKLAVKTTLYFY